MNTFSRFIPSFASPPSASSNAQLRHGKPQQQFDHLARINTDDHVNAEFAGQWDADECEDELLGLQRVMADAQNPRRPVIGSWMMFPGANLARMVAQLGYDFILVDCEHGNIDDAAMHASVGAIAGEGVSPLVRIPKLDVGTVKRALDCGAHGILCPSISTVDDARALVSYSKFPATTKPLTNQSSKKLLSGIRGVGSPFAPSVFRQSLAEYIRTANRNTFIAIQIETTEGLSNCEEIAKVDGIDMLFIGPNDLASSMGYPPLSHESIPEVQEAIERILAAAHKAGKYAGMFCTQAEHVRRRYAQGFDLMNLGGDVVALMEWNNEQLARLDDITGKKSTSAMYY
uniref:HpcH/HpaI aldolase/citrate lyase domain-containing protein n=1 Tax=Psilocybe cubensis TaxID=181762 RepID=A0A8H7XYB8_PSICU